MGPCLYGDTQDLALSFHCILFSSAFRRTHPTDLMGLCHVLNPRTAQAQLTASPGRGDAASHQIPK